LRLLREAVAASEPFNAAILDMQMPNMDGLTLARSIKADPVIAGTRLLLMTSLGPRNDTALLRAAGIGAFLVKPVKQSQLVECLIGITGSTSQHETRFWLDRKDRPVDLPASAKTLQGRDKPFHILVAEDNTINQRVAIGLLEKLGFRSEAVANGKEVLKAMELVSYDIILMDCQLPELDGYKATMEIRQRERSNGSTRRTYIIAMTAHAVRGAREKCLAAGMDDYISKPVQLTELDAVLQRGINYLQTAVADTNGSPQEGVVDPNTIATLRTLRSADRPDPVAELIDLFIRDTPVRIEEMRSAATQYDHARLAAAAHNLKGCASSIGAHKMAALCGELEERAESKAIQVATRLLGKVEREFERVRNALEHEKKN